MKKLLFLMNLLILSAAHAANAAPNMGSCIDHYTVKGDFNGDNRTDTACIISSDQTIFNDYPDMDLWKFWKNDKQPPVEDQYLLIKLSENDYYISSSYEGRFDTPSFELLSESSQHYSFDTPKNSDVLILTTEAGIDQIVYFKDGIFHLFVSEEMP